MDMKRITGKSGDIEDIRLLYETAFPENERRDLEDLIDENSEGMEFYGFYEDGVFTALLSLLSYKDITHIMYLAVKEEMQGMGCGTKILSVLRKMKPHQRIIADLERIKPEAENNPQRAMRNAFYEKNGYIPSGVRYNWRGEDYELYVNGGEFAEYEYKNFWKHFSRKKDEDKK